MTVHLGNKYMVSWKTKVYYLVHKKPSLYLCRTCCIQSKSCVFKINFTIFAPSTLSICKWALSSRSSCEYLSDISRFHGGEYEDDSLKTQRYIAAGCHISFISILFAVLISHTCATEILLQSLNSIY
jgi:hypothetical protein